MPPFVFEITLYLYTITTIVLNCMSSHDVQPTYPKSTYMLYIFIYPTQQPTHLLILHIMYLTYISYLLMTYLHYLYIYLP